MSAVLTAGLSRSKTSITRHDGERHSEKYLDAGRLSETHKEARMDLEAIQRSYVGACRAQLHALRPLSPEWERAAERLEAAETELDRLVAGKQNSRLVSNQTAA